MNFHILCSDFFFWDFFFPYWLLDFFFNLEITYCYILKFFVYIYSSLLLKCILIYNWEMSSNQEYLFFSFITSGFSHICNKALCHHTTMFIQTNTIKIFKVSFQVYKVHILKCLVLLEFSLMYNVWWGYSLFFSRWMVSYVSAAYTINVLCTLSWMPFLLCIEISIVWAVVFSVWLHRFYIVLISNREW